MNCGAFRPRWVADRRAKNSKCGIAQDERVRRRTGIQTVSGTLRGPEKRDARRVRLCCCFGFRMGKALAREATQRPWTSVSVGRGRGTAARGARHGGRAERAEARDGDLLLLSFRQRGIMFFNPELPQHGICCCCCFFFGSEGLCFLIPSCRS